MYIIAEVAAHHIVAGAALLVSAGTGVLVASQIVLALGCAG
jgi:hypothetical protein